MNDMVHDDVHLFEQVLLFNPGKPFSRGQSYMNQDIDLMIDCFVSCFRINPHNNEALKVCLNPHSPPTFHYVLVASLYRYKNQFRWIIDCLRIIFLSVLQNNHTAAAVVVAPH